MRITDSPLILPPTETIEHNEIHTDKQRHDDFTLNPEMDTQKPETGQACPLPRRLLVMLYDSFVVLALLLLATLLALLAGSGQVTAGKDIFFTLYLFLVWFLYLAWCWRNGGLTVGMRAWRVRIESAQGQTPGWGQCAARFLVSLASAACLGLGFAWSLFEPQKRTWHDMVSRTRLLRS